MTEMERIADGLLVWLQRVYGATYFKDVLAWQDGNFHCFAGYGSPAKLQRAIQLQARNYRSALDLGIARALGIQMSQDRSGYVSPQFFSSGESASFQEIVEGVEGAIREVLGEEQMVRFTVIPEPGQPFADQPTRYYSAKRKKFLISKMPAGVVPVSFRDRSSDQMVVRPGINFCLIAPPVPASQHGTNPVMEFRDGSTSIVAHSLAVNDRDMPASLATAQLVGQCGGMLFPSLSVGPIPATNFGPVVLIADPRIVLDGLKPYRKRSGEWPAVVYSTDTWTLRTRDFIGETSSILYDQMVGRWEITYYTALHLWILGPPIEQEGGPAGGRRIDSVTAMASAIKRRMKPWMKVSNKQQFVDLNKRFAAQESYYSYLEAKVNAIMPMDRFVVAVVPDWLAGSAGQWLATAGYRGPVVPLAVPGSQDAYNEASRLDSDERSFRQFQWALQVGSVAVQTMKRMPV